MYSQEADIGVGPLTITAERDEVIDFTYAFMDDGMGIIMQKPTKDQGKILRVFTPLSNRVWLLLLASFFIISLILCGVNWVLPQNQLIYPGQEPYQKTQAVDDNIYLDSKCNAGNADTNGINTELKGEPGEEPEWYWTEELRKSLWFVFACFMGRGK